VPRTSLCSSGGLFKLRCHCHSTKQCARWATVFSSRSETFSGDERGILSAGDACDIFAEVVWRDRVYGALLGDIKAGYETFLSQHGAEAPRTPIRFCRDGEVLVPVPDPPPPACDTTEQVVEAARRWWVEPSDIVSRVGAEARIKELELENAALQSFIARLQCELTNEAAAAKATGTALGPLQNRDGAHQPTVKIIQRYSSAPAGEFHVGAAQQDVCVLAEPPSSAPATPRGGDVTPSNASSASLEDAWRVMKRPSPLFERPPHVPALDLSQLMHLLDDEDTASASFRYPG